MNIGQAISNIIADKKKVYHATCDERFIYKLKYSFSESRIVVLCTFDAETKIGLSRQLLDMDWELDQTPVSFMKVVESRKEFRAEHELISPDEWDMYISLCDFLEYLTCEFDSKQISQILTEGKFYIQEEKDLSSTN